MSSASAFAGEPSPAASATGQATTPAATAPTPNLLDPRGRLHIPIGVADSLDALKTFVEAQGCFSPGFASYGIYFWLYDPDARRLFAPTMPDVPSQHGLTDEGYLIPWTTWNAGDISVTTEVCHVERPASKGPVHVAAARVHVTNRSKALKKASLYVALRPLGPAGGPVQSLSVSEAGDALMVDGHPAVAVRPKPAAAGVLPSDTIAELALKGERPTEQGAASSTGDCSGALVVELLLSPNRTRTVTVACPVLPGRRAPAHQWDGKNPWAQLDDAAPNPAEGGLLQIDPGIDYARILNVDQVFEEAQEYWKNLVGNATLRTPDARWNQAFAAIVGHAALAMNDGAPDVAVVNYNVFNRDGAYTANILQKAGRHDLAAEAIDYFLAHPFNGRIHPEADNPGQILWVMGEHWRYTRERRWLERVLPGAAKLAAMIRYYRTTPGPHYVALDSLEFGDALPKEKRKELKPGSCDGHHPEYTQAWDIAGLRGAALLAQAAGRAGESGDFAALADKLQQQYDQQFGARLPKDYGSYCVLWPCRLYPLNQGKGFDAFGKVGTMKPAGWRYFPLATAHQGLLSGNRQAGYATLDLHLEHEQMRGWYAFDEGGKSGAGGWRFARTTWNKDVAMPHGWAIAEVWLLLRDSLVFEDGERLVLLGGVPAAWLSGAGAPRTQPQAAAAGTIELKGLPTHFGKLTLTYHPTDKGAVLTLEGAAPPQGFVLRLPAELRAVARVGDRTIPGVPNGDIVLPADARSVELLFGRP